MESSGNYQCILYLRFHVSLTNMPIAATEEAGFYLGHRLVGFILKLL